MTVVKPDEGAELVTGEFSELLEVVGMLLGLGKPPEDVLVGKVKVPESEMGVEEEL